MPAFFVQGEELKAVAQLLLEMSAKARSLETTIQSLEPLTDDDEIIERLKDIKANAQAIKIAASSIYPDVARAAFGPPAAASSAIVPPVK